MLWALNLTLSTEILLRMQVNRWTREMAWAKREKWRNIIESA